MKCSETYTEQIHYCKFFESNHPPYHHPLDIIISMHLNNSYHYQAFLFFFCLKLHQCSKWPLQKNMALSLRDCGVKSVAICCQEVEMALWIWKMLFPMSIRTQADVGINHRRPGARVIIGDRAVSSLLQACSAVLWSSTVWNNEMAGFTRLGEKKGGIS